MRFSDIMTSMNLKQMEYFVRVAETGGFARAALLLEVAQSSLSRQIRLLEVELRQTLFYRNGRGVELTEAGKRFFEHARAMLESVARARSDLSELNEDPTGHIIIGLPPRVGRLFTAPLVQAFRTRFPRASICIAEGLSTTLREWLQMGRIELALLFSPPSSSQLVLQPLFREELVLVGHASHRLHLPAMVKFSQLGGYPLMLPQMPNATRALLESVCKRTGTQLKISVEVDTVQAILELVMLNQGFAILPRSVIAKEARAHKVAISHIRTPSMWSNLVLANSRQRPFTRLAHETKKQILALDLPKIIAHAGAQ